MTLSRTQGSTPAFASIRPVQWIAEPIDRRSNSRSGERSSQARDGAGQAAHLHDPAGGVVILGEHTRVVVHIAEQPLLRCMMRSGSGCRRARWRAIGLTAAIDITVSLRS
jgi:hypothetical protein